MASERHNISWIRRFDWISAVLWALLSIAGLVAIYSATMGPVSEFLPRHIQENFSKQATWFAISAVALVFIMFLNPRSFQQFSYLFYFVILLITIATIFFGVEVNGANSWLDIGGFRLQSSELMKLATVLAVASYLTSRRDISAVRVKSALIATVLILIPVIVIILQNDTGTALVFLPLIPVMLFLSGLPHGVSVMMISPAIIGYVTIIDWKIGIIVTVILGVIIWFLQKKLWMTLTTFIAGILFVFAVDIALHDILLPHQQLRIEAFVNPFLDPQGAGWNVIQAKTAISSGGIYGKGFLMGTQTQLRFLPAQWTDFIYCVIAEEFGLIGGGLVLLLMLFLFLRLLNLAINLKDPFSQLVLVGVTTIFFTHALINLGSAMGLFPVIGVPLPFMSYGGSSFLANTIMLGVCLNLHLRAKDMSQFA